MVDILITYRFKTIQELIKHFKGHYVIIEHLNYILNIVNRALKLYGNYT